MPDHNFNGEWSFDETTGIFYLKYYYKYYTEIGMNSSPDETDQRYREEKLLLLSTFSLDSMGEQRNYLSGILFE